MRKHLPAVLAVILLVGLVAVYSAPGGDQGVETLPIVDTNTTDINTTTTTEDPAIAEERARLEEEIATITFATAVHDHKIAVEWEAAAEAQRVFDEQARQERQRQAQAQQTQARASAPAPSGGAGCVLPQYICDRESGHEGYSAHNNSSGASGRYQLMPSTADSIAASIGRHDLIGVPANQMSPADQDLLASTLYANGAGACHWTPPNYCG